MKQKFTFEIDRSRGILSLSESGETDPGTFVDVHKEEYPLEEIKTALGSGRDIFIEKLRRRNLFPPLDLAVRLFESLKEFMAQGEGDRLVVDYQDTDSMSSVGFRLDEEEEDEEDVGLEIDDLLKDSVEDLTEDDIKEIDSDDDTLRYLPDDDSELEN
ncbi:MAG: hypothetical protein V1793_19065 [Pseudomonadota bacterium]